MKRLLIATTAVGLCLAAPAFAQSTTTDQDKQRANQPASSTPSSQAAPSSSSGTSSTQSGSQSQPSSPSAQAPSSNQRGQAQNQQQPSGSSSTNAQAPASSSQSSQSATTNQTQDSKRNRAQTKQKPSDSSTSAQAPSSTNQSTGTSETSRTGRADSRASRSDRTSASLNVNINDQQRTRIASVISSGNVRAVNVNFRLNVGVAVPRTVVLHTLPASIIEIVPEYRGYSYFVTREQIVIVEPRRKTIVAVLPAGGAARAQATSERVRFTDQQREVIRKRSSSLRSIETTGSSASYVIEQEIPATVELQEFPAEIVTEVPVVRSYRYFRQNNDVIVVDPGQRRVIEVIR